jgi:chromosome segregation protein
MPWNRVVALTERVCSVHLKRLEIQGFKTFAQRTVIDFRHGGVTAIVGPNGSGKSNVSDAVRWVMGEQSFATLRCKRTEELLFSGGPRRAPAGLAEVSLTFDNSDRLLPLDFDEVTFTRRATRAGDNEYFINRAKVRLRDILEASEPLGGSYTIINQGLVDTALTLRPEERRRLFEDAAEIGSFESRKNETERRLRETDANMQRVVDLLSELEPRVRSLKRQANQARQYRELSTELQGLLRLHYAALWRAAQEALRLALQQVGTSEQRLHAAREAQTTSSAALREVRSTLRELRERLGGLHQESSDLHQRAEIAQRELAVSNERHAALARRAEESERSLQELTSRAEEATREHEAAQERFAEAEQLLQERREIVEQRQSALSRQEAARLELAQTLRQAQDNALKAATALAQLHSRIEQLQQQRSQLAGEQATLALGLHQAEKTLSSAKQQADHAQQSYKSARQALEALQHEEETTRTALDQLRRERSAADEAVAAARRSFADVEARRDSLERLARSYAGVFAGVKAAMQWAERSNRSGFVLISSIVRTPPELETAIEVALGSRLQHIVVERWEDAEAAIAELKRSNAGRATFMPLDSLRTNERSGGYQSRNPDVLGVAVELIEFDEHYRAVVQQLLGRTLVVRDLPTARSELRQLGGGWVIVTLGGEQVNTGGSVTGGAQTRESGALRRERELRELPQQLAAAQERIATMEAAQKSAHEQLSQAEQRLRQAEAQRREAQRNLESLRNAFNSAQRAAERAEQDLNWQRSRVANASTNLQALEAQASNLAESLAAAEAAQSQAEAHLAEVRARQEAEAGADTLAQSELSVLRAELATAQAEAKAGRTIAQGLAQTLERLERQRDESAQRLAEAQRERDQIAPLRASLEQNHAELLAQIDLLRQEIGPAEEVLKEREQHQAELEGQEAARTAALLAQEADYNRAVLEQQRALDRIETLKERAASDLIEIETLESEPPLDAEGQPIEPPSSTSIQQMRERISRLGNVNPLALEEYEEANERQEFMTTQLDDLRRAQQSLRELIAELDQAMAERFHLTFQAVAAEFEQSFTKLFGGGTAQLRLVREGDDAQVESNGHASNGSAEFDKRPVTGVEIIARPPGKRAQNISLLSGGERTLTAAALLLAILRVNPSPFCILDEMDAALDESNVGRFRDALLELSEQTQFIVITHNRGTIEAASTLYGISMGDDSASRVLSLKLEELVEED